MADGVGAGEREATGQIAGRTERSRALDAGGELRNRDTSKHRRGRNHRQQVDERVAYCPGCEASCFPAAAGGVTLTSGRIFRKFFSPMPLTFIRSSTFLKPPFFCL